MRPEKSNGRAPSPEMIGSFEVDASCGLDRGHFLRVLDEIDHGALVVDAHAHILHHNHLARQELGCGRLLVSREQVLVGATVDASRQLERALVHACQGERQLVVFRTAGHQLSASFVLLTHALEADPPMVLMLLSRQNVGENLAVRLYARSQGLSPAEEVVLIGLCRGHSVPDIARANGVADSTVRTQVKSLREKTRAPSIRHLMVWINTLPPVLPGLRSTTPFPPVAVKSC